MIKKVISILLAFCLLLSFNTLVFADTDSNTTDINTENSPAGIVTPMAATWTAPNGGVWTLSKYSGSQTPGTVVYTKMTFLSPSVVSAKIGTKLLARDVDELVSIIEDAGKEAAAKYLEGKLGKTMAAKFIPYLAHASVAYDVFTAILAYQEDAVYVDAQSKGKGVKLVEGYTVDAYNGPVYFDGAMVWDNYNKVVSPSNHIGSFSPYMTE